MIVSEANHSDKSVDLAQPWFGHLLNSAAFRVRVATAEALHSLGISPPQLRALEAIAASQPLNQSRLGEIVRMDRTTIVHLVDHLERLGAATREADPADRRSHAIVLTREGMKILTKGRARARAVEDELLTPLTRPERALLLSLLHQLHRPTSCPEEKKREPSTPPSDA